MIEHFINKTKIIHLSEINLCPEYNGDFKEIQKLPTALSV